MSDTKDKILQKVNTLFYTQGYTNTGIDQITKEIGITKPTLYHHFESKNNLGLAYLEVQKESIIQFLTSILNKSKSYDDYLKNWANALLVLSKKKQFHGCPFTAFASEMKPEDRPIFEERLREVEIEWLSFQEKAYLNYFPHAKNSKEIACKILVLHTGCVMLYRSSMDIKYIQQMKKEFSLLSKSMDSSMIE
jgi:AcrR family transcriptional regulator